MNYTYTAVITPDKHEKKFYCRVPDLDGCVTTAATLSEAIDMIRDAASVWLVSAEDHGEPVIKPTPQKSIPRDENDILSVIQIDTIRYRAETDTHAVRKSVSIPAWMANIAGKYGLNLSKILQDGIQSAIEARM
ncbi:MAG: type II toxin-antitoxin system HicB family antitoxin [Lachnospiraceae bacterium]|nr:type II toxin-antitoxin system HicB family antitoxin [Lachnospiraceae bacterium]